MQVDLLSLEDQHSLLLSQSLRAIGVVVTAVAVMDTSNLLTICCCGITTRILHTALTLRRLWSLTRFDVSLLEALLMVGKFQDSWELQHALIVQTVSFVVKPR